MLVFWGGWGVGGIIHTNKGIYTLALVQLKRLQ